jgi:hypothetical protein
MISKAALVWILAGVGSAVALGLVGERLWHGGQARPRRVSSGATSTIFVKSGENLQAAIADAQYGDTIVLEAGGVFETPYGFYLPDKGPGTKTDADYITVRTSNMAGLPSEGVRVSLANTKAMSKIVATGALSAIEAKKGAHHYKFIGIEFTNKDPKVSLNSLISSEHYIPQGTDPHHIIVDRCIIRPIEDTMNLTSTNRSVKRGFWIEGSEISLINSYLSGFASTDSQGVLVVAGPGPYHFINNFLEAWYANIFLGGGGRPPILANTGVVQPGATLTSATLSAANNLSVGDLVSFPQSTGENANGQVLTKNGNSITFTSLYKFDPKCGCGVPSTAPAAGTIAAWNGQQINGVEIVRNTFNKRPEWISAGSEPKGYFEFKNGNNVTVEGNIFQGYPAVMAITSRNDSGANPWSTVNNLVIRNNKIVGYREGIIYLGKDMYSLSTQSVGLTIANNLFIPMDTRNNQNYQAKLIQLDNGRDVQIYHNTVIGNQTHIISGQTTTTGLVLRDNILYHGEYGFSCFQAPNTIGTCWPGLKMTGNVIVDNRSDNSGDPVYPSGNFFPDSLDQVGFVDYRKGDYRLSKSSPFRLRASDRKDPGVDLDVLLARIPASVTGAATSGIQH